MNILLTSTPNDLKNIADKVSGKDMSATLIKFMQRVWLEQQH
jgi:hypothetical protein